jgi:hypothetical protein
MQKRTVLTCEFVEYIPNKLMDGTLYVSMAFATAVHRCCCGCGNEVVTPLSPTDWRLTFDGQSITLHPSIGNWNFPCQSHYWIVRNRVVWARRWSQAEIMAGRDLDQLVKETYFESTDAVAEEATTTTNGDPGEPRSKQPLWQRIRNWWLSLPRWR